MNRVLNRRNLRSLKSRFPRYLALLLLIVMGVYLIISIVGSAEMIIQDTEKQKKFNKVFQVKHSCEVSEIQQDWLSWQVVTHFIYISNLV